MLWPVAQISAMTLKPATVVKLADTTKNYYYFFLKPSDEALSAGFSLSLSLSLQAV